MGLISGGHVTPPGSVKLRIAVTMLGILGGSSCVAVFTYEREAGIGDCRLC